MSEVNFFDMDRYRKDKFVRWLVRKLPDSIIYYAAIRLGVHATTGKYSAQVVPDLTLLDAIQRWVLKE
ncbi:MAG: hypothetical protein ACXAEN_21860 [Candidatus Thorarchaeota archaeon]|jgi:hypothetical protein